MGHIVDLGKRIELVPMDGRCHDITLALYEQPSSDGTAARVRVLIESSDGQDVWGTVGVSENIIEASWIALADSLHFKLMHDAMQAGADQPGRAATA